MIFFLFIDPSRLIFKIRLSNTRHWWHRHIKRIECGDVLLPDQSISAVIELHQGRRNNVCSHAISVVIFQNIYVFIQVLYALDLIQDLTLNWKNQTRWVPKWWNVIHTNLIRLIIETFRNVTFFFFPSLLIVHNCLVSHFNPIKRTTE